MQTWEIIRGIAAASGELLYKLIFCPDRRKETVSEAARFNLYLLPEARS